MAPTATRLERESGIAPTWSHPEFYRVRVGPGPGEVDTFLEHLGLQTTEVQRYVLHLDWRLILVAGGERAGKSFVSGTFLSTRAPYGSLYWIVADNYDLCRPEFNYAVEQLSQLGAVETSRDVSIPKVGKASVRLKTGQFIETKTADDVRKLAAVAPDGIIIAEAAQCGYDVFLRCVGRVAEKRGWLLMSGTFEGSMSWYAEKFNEWQDMKNLEGGLSISMPSWSNHFIYPKGRDDPEIKRLEAIYSRVEGMFDERCGAVPVPPVGLVFREFRHTIHVRDDATFDPALPVYLAVDPAAGGNPYSVLACQFRPREVVYGPQHPDPIDTCVVFDEIYEQWTDEQMITEALSRKWWKNVAGGAIDIEAPDSRKRWLRYTKKVLVSEKIKQLEGIRRLKSFLSYQKTDAGVMTSAPHLVIHPSVRSLPYEFGRYKRKDAVDDDREPREIPPDDQPNHSIKALWYLLIARYGYVRGSRLPRVVQTWHRPQMRVMSPLSSRRES